MIKLIKLSRTDTHLCVDEEWKIEHTYDIECDELTIEWCLSKLTKIVSRYNSNFIQNNFTSSELNGVVVIHVKDEMYIFQH